MKYFTPDLHSRTCSKDDAVADAAHAEWETALERYEKRLQRIRPVLTPGVRQLAEGLRLHDARLLLLGRSNDRCYLALQTESVPAAIVSLEYFLTADPRIETDAIPVSLRTTGCLFLYDEVDVTSRNGKQTFSQCILFTNGLHLRLKFSDVSVRVVDSLLELPDAVTGRVMARPA